MRMIRLVIDSVTRVIGYVRRHRRIRPNNACGIVKINLGCGLAVAKTWINVDGSLNALVASWPRAVHRLLYRASGSNRYYTCEQYCSLLEEHEFVHHDLSYGIPFADESADFVYSSHFLEHMHGQDATYLLQEAFRVLKPRGLVRVCVPDLAHAVGLYAAGKKKDMLSNYFFVEDKESYYARHKYMYDFELLSEVLKSAGFEKIARQAYRQGKTPDLDVLDNRPEETLYVEAVKI